jgi:hypothetical protein
MNTMTEFLYYVNDVNPFPHYENYRIKIKEKLFSFWEANELDGNSRESSSSWRELNKV